MDKILLSQLIKDLGVVKTDCEIISVVSDSRKVCENCVFLAIKGERVNGEDFAVQAVKDGAKLVITENEIEGLSKDLQLIVPNVLDASITLGKNFRDKFSIEVIGVTGSVGKTSTKDFIFAALSPFAKTVKSLGNQNNELGVPNTIYGFTQEDKFAILEMGMANFNDIHKLSIAARPKAAVISCIGVSHLQQMKTQENILKAKLEICDGMADEGILVLNGDDKFLSKATITKPKNVYYFAIDNPAAQVRAENIRQEGLSTYFEIMDKENGKFPCVIPTVGLHNVLNALSAYTAVTRLGFDCRKTAENLKGYEPSGMRQKVVEKDGIIYIEDCYNASPDSMHAALNALTSVAKGRKIAVLGDMLELGDDSAEMHKEVGKYAKEKGVDQLWCQGQEAKHICEGFGDAALHFESKGQIADFIKENLKKGDTIIFKASNGMKFWDIIQQVYEK